MWDIITKIWLCLLIAAFLGGLIVWLWHRLKCSAKFSEYENEIARLKSSAGSVSSSANAENAKDDAEIASLKKQIKTLETDLEVCHGRQETMEGELKAFTLGSVGATGGDTSALQAEIDALKTKLGETENERVYLLGQVKKAESGESIKREVPMDQRDDLELIHGVGPVLERMLYDMGIYFFKDIAQWDATKITEITEKLPNFKGRIEREGWVESAKEEHFKKYGEKL